MLLQYVHDVNAKVEQGRRYLSDVVQVKLEKVTIPAVKDGETVVKPAYDVHRVTAYPAIQTGEQSITTVPVHPKTEGVTKTVPTYGVPETLKVLVRLAPNEIKQDTAGAYANNWTEQVVEVHPIVLNDFPEAEFEKAQDFYEEVIHQLFQGDDIRNYGLSGQTLRNRYADDNSRSH